MHQQSLTDKQASRKNTSETLPPPICSTGNKLPQSWQTEAALLLPLMNKAENTGDKNAKVLLPKKCSFEWKIQTLS